MARTRPASWIAALALALALPLSTALPAWAEGVAEPPAAAPSDVVTPSADPAPDQTPPDPDGQPAQPGQRSLPSATTTSGDEAQQLERIGILADEDPEPVASVHGYVGDSYSFDPIPGATVELWAQDADEVAATATVDDEGHYSLPKVADGDYKLYVSASGFFAQWWSEYWWENRDIERWQADVVTVTAGVTATVELTLDPRASISGTITNSLGKPVGNALVTLYRWSDADGDWDEEGSIPTSTAADGRFKVGDLRPGLYEVGDYDLPKGSRVQASGTDGVTLLSFSGMKVGGVLEPTVSGTPWTGNKLVAKPGQGTWKSTTFSYQWLRSGEKIAKATGSSYTVTAADRGHMLQVRVTSKHGYNRFTITSPTTWPAMLAAVPKISGSVASGQKLTAVTGTWQDGTTFGYQWYADGKAISGATKQTFTLTSSQKAKRITVKVTGTYRENIPATSRTSAATAKVATAGTPTVSGTRVVGGTLKAKTGTWTKKTKFSYQWLRNGVAISKATKSSYKLTSADAGKSITVKVTGKRSGYATVSRTSADAPLVIKAATPTISGAAGTGKTLTAKPGSWTAGAAFSYQWYAGGKAISGATGDSLVLTGSQAGKQITVRVTGRVDGYATASKTSKATAKVLKVGAVSISGTATVGSVLTAKAGTWTSKTKLSYQWLRDGVALSGATRSSYRVQAADVGTTVTVRVTGKRSGYATVSTTAAIGVAWG